MACVVVTEHPQVLSLNAHSSPALSTVEETLSCLVSFDGVEVDNQQYISSSHVPWLGCMQSGCRFPRFEGYLSLTRARIVLGSLFSDEKLEVFAQFKPFKTALFFSTIHLTARHLSRDCIFHCFCSMASTISRLKIILARFCLLTSSACVKLNLGCGKFSLFTALLMTCK
jgi:hypothetical protein